MTPLVHVVERGQGAHHTHLAHASTGTSGSFYAPLCSPGGLGIPGVDVRVLTPTEAKERDRPCPPCEAEAIRLQQPRAPAPVASERPTSAGGSRTNGAMTARPAWLVRWRRSARASAVFQSTVEAPSAKDAALAVADLDQSILVIETRPA